MNTFKNGFPLYHSTQLIGKMIWIPKNSNHSIEVDFCDLEFEKLEIRFLIVRSSPHQIARNRNTLCRCFWRSLLAPPSMSSACSSEEISRSFTSTQSHRITLVPPLICLIVWFEVTQVMSLIHTFRFACPRYYRVCSRFSVHAIKWYAKQASASPMWSTTFSLRILHASIHSGSASAEH